MLLSSYGKIARNLRGYLSFPFQKLALIAQQSSGMANFLLTNFCPLDLKIHNNKSVTVANIYIVHSKWKKNSKK